jgi:hypothetical protein
MAKRFLNTKRVRNRYGDISDRTVDRWTKSASCPRPVTLTVRNIGTRTNSTLVTKRVGTSLCEHSPRQATARNSSNSKL